MPVPPISVPVNYNIQTHTQLIHKIIPFSDQIEISANVLWIWNVKLPVGFFFPVCVPGFLAQFYASGNIILWHTVHIHQEWRDTNMRVSNKIGISIPTYK